MRFWHIVKDNEGLIREQYICGCDKKKFSMECLEQILGGTYEIFPQGNYSE
jgi:hypothetical protein